LVAQVNTKQLTFSQGSAAAVRIGAAGKLITDVLQINSIYYVPNIIDIGERL